MSDCTSLYCLALGEGDHEACDEIIPCLHRLVQHAGVTLELDHLAPDQEMTFPGFLRTVLLTAKGSTSFFGDISIQAAREFRRLKLAEMNRLAETREERRA